MHSAAETKTSTTSLDITLLLNRLEQIILSGDPADKYLTILNQEKIWMRLDPVLQLRWAQLAQMAGQVETALGVFAHLNSSRPDCTDAWRQRVTLLRVLDHRTAAAAVLARAQQHLPAETYRKLEEDCAGLEAQFQPIPESKDPLEPFDALRRRQAGLEKFMMLFAGREDCFARQWADRNEKKAGYVPVRRPLQPQDVEEHLRGHKTYGIYLMRRDATVTTAVIDADLAIHFRDRPVTAEMKQQVHRERAWLFRRVQELSKSGGFEPLVEFSGGKGFHFWYFMAEPVPASQLRGILESIKHSLAGDLNAFVLEVFPKQDHLSGKGFGNLVKLPLGVHRLTGKRSRFLACTDTSDEAQLAFLQSIQATAASDLPNKVHSSAAAQVVLHPRLEEWANEFPELYQLEQRCPPLSQIMAACREGSDIALREKRILYSTLGFLARRKKLMHHLLSRVPEYNLHEVDYRISRISGLPLGCKRIHSLLNYAGDYCRFESPGNYPHPLLHLQEWQPDSVPLSNTVETLQDALAQLELIIAHVKRLLPQSTMQHV